MAENQKYFFQSANFIWYNVNSCISVKHFSYTVDLCIGSVDIVDKGHSRNHLVPPPSFFLLKFIFLRTNALSFFHDVKKFHCI